MSSEVIAVLSTLVGAIVAGVISYAAGRGMKTHEWRLRPAEKGNAFRKTP